ncbi:MAG: NAD(P)-dependent oxidoreductase, partial [Deltaproteobacteria bacterium]|nr:NAD(P)-dependent oxidoreductase [Deltaproteobacteria bacterium]
MPLSGCVLRSCLPHTFSEAAGCMHGRILPQDLAGCLWYKISLFDGNHMQQEFFMHNVGFIGLGTMGTPMAWNIHRAGFRLGVSNRSAEKCSVFAGEGIGVFESPADLAQWADIVIIMVFGPEALMEVLGGPGGAARSMAAGKTVINMSTVSREVTLAAQELVSSCGASFLDAPVAGSKKPAQDGSLTILAGGSPDVLERVRPVLACLGKVIIHCGQVGAGTDMKLFINVLLGTLMQSFAEALTLGTSFGLRLADMLAAVKNSAVACPMFSVKGTAISSGNFEKNFPVELIFKDLNLALQAAGREH